MANKYTNLNDLFTAMANAIRLKNESTGTIIADNFPTEIANLKTRFDYNNQNVAVLPDHAFYGCEGLNNVDCYNLTNVGASAFEDCKNLKTVILYDGVESVGENAFKGCNEDLTIYCMFDNKPDTWHENWNPDDCKVVWNSAIETWNISVTEEDNVTAKLYNDINNEGYYTLIISGSGNMKDYSVSNSAPWYGYRYNIKSVAIFDSVISIGNYAFYNCSRLTSIDIPDGVTSIGKYVFDDCTSLTSIIIPDSVTSIGSGAFHDTPWLEARRQENPLVIVNNILIDGQTCSGDVVIPDSVTNINGEAFYHCTNLTSVIIPDSVTSIGEYAFENCTSLTSITIPDSVTSIGYDAFRSCSSLASITIPDSVTTIGRDAFNKCASLASITIPNSVISIGTQAFRECTSLTFITIPDSVTRINDYAFYKCTNLASITYIGTVAQWKAMSFGSGWNMSTGNYTIHCTDGDITKDGTITYHIAT